MRRQVVAVTVLATLVGCDSNSPTRPDASPRQDASPTVTGITVTGDEKFTELNQIHALTATAQMSNGTARDITAEAMWQSSNRAVVNVSSRGEATSIGLGSATVTARSQSISGSLEVTVNPVNPSEPLSGLYRLAFTAATACRTLPDWARHREYDATIEQAGTLLTLFVELRRGFSRGFWGAIKGTRVEFYFTTDDPYGYHGGGDPFFSEPIDAARRFTVEGTATGTLRDARIAGTLSGTIRAVNPVTRATLAECGSGSFNLERR